VIVGRPRKSSVLECKEELNWFSLAKYDGLKDLDVLGWFQQIQVRRSLYHRLVFDYPNRIDAEQKFSSITSDAKSFLSLIIEHPVVDFEENSELEFEIPELRTPVHPTTIEEFYLAEIAADKYKTAQARRFFDKAREYRTEIVRDGYRVDFYGHAASAASTIDSELELADQTQDCEVIDDCGFMPEHFYDMEIRLRGWAESELHHYLALKDNAILSIDLNAPETVLVEQFRCELNRLKSEHQNRRDYRREKQVANMVLVNKLITVREQADSGALDNENWMYLIRALIACPLPYRATTQEKITRRTYFDKKWFKVTYLAGRANIPMPYGVDNRLLHWLFNRGLRQVKESSSPDNPENRVVPFQSTYEYLIDCGMSRSVENYKTAREGFRRLSGLAITVEEEQDGPERGAIVPLLEKWCLPKSINDQDDTNKDLFQDPRYGVVLSKHLFEHSLSYFIRMPPQIWRLLKGKPQQAAILLWMYTRAWSAQYECKIKWTILREQLWYDESNPRRIATRARHVLALLHTMWPDANVRIEPDGIVFDKAKSYLVPDNESRNRIRRM
jgi:hypothetical protein